jgi:syntenin-1
MVGLRFGDQILQINNENVAGFSKDKVHDVIKKASINDIILVVRDRPFERTLTLHKDSAGHVGFTFTNGKIDAIVKDSSAARNGLLIDHNLLEVNGQNVVGMKDKDIRLLMENGGDIITITIMPSFVYEHMIKK